LATVRAFGMDAMRPRSAASRDDADTLLSEAIYSAFPMETVDAVMTWGEERVRLSYRYVIADIIDDVLEMVHVMTAAPRRGRWRTTWPSNSFAGDWSMEWEGDALTITAEGREEFQASRYLVENDRLETSKRAYLRYWGEVLEATLDGLIECGYSAGNLEDFDALPEAIELIRRHTE